MLPRYAVKAKILSGKGSPKVDEVNRSNDGESAVIQVFGPSEVKLRKCRVNFVNGSAPALSTVRSTVR